MHDAVQLLGVVGGLADEAVLRPSRIVERCWILLTTN